MVARRPQHSPHTPRTPREGRYYRRDELSPPAPRHGHRNPPDRWVPQYRRTNSHVIYRKSTGPRSPPKWRRRPDYWRPNNELYSPPSVDLEPTFSSLSIDDRWRGEDVHHSPQKISTELSPDAREKAFAEIINGAFDSESLYLGKSAPPRLAGPSETESSGIGKTGPIYRPCEEKIESLPREPSPGRPNHPYSSCEKPLQSPSIDSSASTIDGTVHQPEEMKRLMRMIRLNPNRSKELADLVYDFLYRRTKVSQEANFEKCNGLQAKLQQLRGSSPILPQVATLSGGGDSPPRRPGGMFRGHMIDKPDPDIHSGLSAHASEATTRDTSAAVEDVELIPPTPLPGPHDFAPRHSVASNPTSGVSDHPSNSTISYTRRDGSPLPEPLCPGAGPCCDHWIATYYNTLAALSPSSLSPEDWRAVRSALASSPESPPPFDLNEIKVCSSSSGSQGSGEVAACSGYENTTYSHQDGLPFRPKTAMGVNNGDQQDPSLRIESLNAEVLKRPSKRGLSRHKAIPRCPRTPVSSPCEICGQHHKAGSNGN
ncbi:hypothetical protein CPC735_048490 [Coccidioides posadasii C735 delta SOWgp]|uniref:Uncharacterized protein n=2 Tax=Coccidioides posadasii TaxID=199306 RepID=A0A0J6EWC0_COCPO|nr:hypothetical protein CPC735_048490 [Coccidioides posadasii C735 delta SOWgp]EER23479.1 hypothetical protein CPC735_048490 [Coccidioides posadasii C735 delta SOWgp]KMM64856.1 hypothetical protein CPAG_01208 [Coccidioides posadasii RMSCC 3488]|eukprot:XP_003065624.1 hypothetical protein CPC735_048490 [Coccidioides posadasii C735 delta SOWgp]